MENRQVQHIEILEKDLDVVISAVNLNILAETNNLELIIANLPRNLRSHIITPLQEQELVIPKFIKLDDPYFPSHIKDFLDAIKSMMAELSGVLQPVSKGGKFSLRVTTRGINIADSGYLQQIQVQKLENDGWRIIGLVGASFSFPSWRIAVNLTSKGEMLNNFCKCING